MNYQKLIDSVTFGSCWRSQSLESSGVDYTGSKMGGSRCCAPSDKTIFQN